MATTTTDDRELLERAGALFTRRVQEVPADRWHAATPCDGWDVRDLVNHLVSEHLWVPDLLGGASVDELGHRYGGDVVGPDPVAAWSSAWAVSRATWAEVDDEQPVGLSRGPTPAAAYRLEMILDLVVHGWDLSRGAGLDESGDREAVERVLAEVESWDDPSASGAFGPPVEVDSDDPLVQLVARLGRRP